MDKHSRRWIFGALAGAASVGIVAAVPQPKPETVTFSRTGTRTTGDPMTYDQAAAIYGKENPHLIAMAQAGYIPITNTDRA